MPITALPTPTEPNIFSEQQEVDLGDAIAEQIQANYKLIEDRELNAYLANIGERLSKNLPITKMQFRFVLVDLPDANAFTLPGGRIYVSRKLVALASTEDELAGVIAHELGHLQVAELSRDMKWLALSGNSRGGVWNVETGEAALHLRGFRGAHITSEGFLYADFPKYEEAERNVAKFDLKSGEVVPGPKIESPNARQIGPYLTVIKPATQLKEGVLEQGRTPAFNQNVVLEVIEAATGRSMWSKAFPKEAPRVWIAPPYNTAVLVWSLKAEAAKLAIKGDAILSQRVNAMKEKEGDYFLQVLDVRTGAELGRLLLETGKGSFRLLMPLQPAILSLSPILRIESSYTRLRAAS